MKSKKVLMAPDYRQGNPYQTLLAQSLENKGWKVSFAHFTYCHFPFLKLLKEAGNVDVLHVHWMTDIIKRITESPSSFKFYLKLFFLVLDCLAVRAKGVKLIWTIHNKLAHQQFDNKKELLIRKTLVKFTSNNIIHSAQALDKINALYRTKINRNTDVIFHGNYEGCYPKPSNSIAELREKQGFNKHDIVILYFGLIRPYKGLDVLISSVNQAKNTNVKLLVAGASKDDNYLEKLTELSKDNTAITFDIQFIADQTLADYLTLADVVVLPFSDTLTSGSTILAMTYGKALVVPDSAKVFGCLPDDGALYFSSPDELTKIIGSMSTDTLIKMGKENRKQALTMGWGKVGELTNAIYCK